MLSIRLLVGICLTSSSMTVSAESLSSALGGAILPDWQFEETRQYDFWIGEWRAN